MRLEALVEGWRREGREVVYVEGNHDPMEGATGRLRPDRWHHDFELSSGERVRVLHGHRFSPERFVHGTYEGLGRHFLALENDLYRRAAPRAVYPFGPGWVVGLWGLVEDRLWRPKMPAKAAPMLPEVDVLVHGHFHFGPGQGRIGRVGEDLKKLPAAAENTSSRPADRSFARFCSVVSRVLSLIGVTKLVKPSTLYL